MILVRNVFNAVHVWIIARKRRYLMDLKGEDRRMANTKKMDYVLLGLLSHEPMTGYEMKKGLIRHSVFSGAVATEAYIRR